MAPYSLVFPTDLDVPALALVAGVLVVAAATKGGYPLWAIGGMIALYVLYIAIRCANLRSTRLRGSRAEPC